jgi:hypothetical protein
MTSYDRPEERVRASLVDLMCSELGYPRSLIAIEKQLAAFPGCSSAPNRRLDIICFTPHASAPLLLIECKAEGNEEAARRQVIGYNFYIGAPFVAIASSRGVETAARASSPDAYSFQKGLPRFEALIEALV